MKPLARKILHSLTRPLHFGFQQEDATVPFGKQQEGRRSEQRVGQQQDGENPGMLR